MKDKLEKTHHKAAYYRTRRITIFGLIAVSASIMISVPTYFSIVSTKSEVELISTYSEIETSEGLETF